MQWKGTAALGFLSAVGSLSVLYCHTRSNLFPALKTETCVELITTVYISVFVSFILLYFNTINCGAASS